MDRHIVSYRHIVQIAYPVTLSMLSMNAMIFVDRMFVSQYNLTQFAAMIPAGLFATSIASIFGGIVGYSSVLVSQYFGARRYNDCSASTWQAVYLSALFVVLLIVSSVGLENIFQVLGHDESLIHFEKEYFYLIISANCFQLFTTALSGLYYGIGDTRTTMHIEIFINVANMVLAWLLVLGKCGFPAMGMFGAGLATNISSAIGLAVYLLRLNQRSFKSRFQFFINFDFNKFLLHKIVKFGLFSGIQSFTITGYFSIFLLIIGMRGEFDLTCANIAVALQAASILPVYGITTAVGILAGQERGADRPDNLTIILKKGILISSCYVILIVIFFNLLPEFLISIFNSEHDKERLVLINNATIPLVRLTSICVALEMVFSTIGSALQAVGDTRFMMVTYTVIPFIFYVIMPYIICVRGSLSLEVLWIMLIGYRIIMLLVVTRRFVGGKWKAINVI
ncbi:MAG TPA: MATE family efflux transporter [Methylomusa anaerophila]|uniref:Probable multidrug resistance protein NorM n=1 Tax=Methylomusa anaerophila TaxID=1930071 RepID=A0A348AQY0_9FIRM|nr:MATE family efflux transporter [Methylomusa anaerophila]BBB93478.1 multidrug resistance protein NorM [Methylomusa anaerophila]HML90595.1 MATE family efflux transporter [Methylomusa anaerophila]